MTEGGNSEFSISAQNSAANVAESFKNERIRRLFQIDSKNLNSDNEMIKMFGARIVQAERNAAIASNKFNFSLFF
jgi:hypothetical protein